MYQLFLVKFNEIFRDKNFGSQVNIIALFCRLKVKCTKNVGNQNYFIAYLMNAAHPEKLFQSVSYLCAANCIVWANITGRPGSPQVQNCIKVIIIIVTHNKEMWAEWCLRAFSGSSQWFFLNRTIWNSFLSYISYLIC